MDKNSKTACFTASQEMGNIHNATLANWRKFGTTLRGSVLVHPLSHVSVIRMKGDPIVVCLRHGQPWRKLFDAALAGPFAA